MLGLCTATLRLQLVPIWLYGISKPKFVEEFVILILTDLFYELKPNRNRSSFRPLAFACARLASREKLLLRQAMPFDHQTRESRRPKSPRKDPLGK